MKLDIVLFRYQTLVFGKVLEQAEELRNPEGHIFRILKTHDEFKLVSVSAPGLNSNNLYIRGLNRAGDDDVFYHNYDSIKEAVEACNAIVELVNQINGKDTDHNGIVRVM